MIRDIVEKNRASLEELYDIVRRLNTPQTARPIANGWTVATQLCHLAFWDGRAAYSLIHWRKTGEAASDLRGSDIDALNLSERDLAAFIPGLTAAHFALNRAESLDLMIESFDDQFAQTVIDAGCDFLLCRYKHRQKHIVKLCEALEISAQ